MQRSDELEQRSVAAPDAPLTFVPAIDSRVELQGKATIGAWKSAGTGIGGKVVLATDSKTLDALFDRIESGSGDSHNHDPSKLPTLYLRTPPIADISIPVMSLHGDSGGMDSDMHSALKATQHSSIEYVFEQFQKVSVEWDPQRHESQLKLKIVGKLIMAGAGRSIPMDVLVKRNSRGHFLAHSQTTVLMTDFGMTPPTALFGLIKASDQVVVIFDLDFIPEDRSPDH